MGQALAPTSFRDFYIPSEEEEEEESQCCKGDQGDQGDPGPAGPQGFPGRPGNAGPAGPAGAPAPATDSASIMTYTSEFVFGPDIVPQPQILTGMTIVPTPVGFTYDPVTGFYTALVAGNYQFEYSFNLGFPPGTTAFRSSVFLNGVELPQSIGALIEVNDPFPKVLTLTIPFRQDLAVGDQLVLTGQAGAQVVFSYTENTSAIKFEAFRIGPPTQ